MNKQFSYVSSKIENKVFPKPVRINLAENIEDVALLLLVALMAAKNSPGSISEDAVHREITNLAEAEEWDELAFKGLSWIQDIVQ